MRPALDPSRETYRYITYIGSTIFLSVVVVCHFFGPAAFNICAVISYVDSCIYHAIAWLYDTSISVNKKEEKTKGQCDST